LSQRDAIDFSLDAQVRDLEAVVNSVDTTPVVLMGAGRSSPPAVRFAAENPTLVSHLILYDAYISDEQHEQSNFSASMRAVGELIAQRGDLADLGRIWGAMVGGVDEDTFADYLKSAITPAALEEALRTRLDCSPWLEGVRCPCLVIEERYEDPPYGQHAVSLAHSLRDAELVTVLRHRNDELGEIADLTSELCRFVGIAAPQEPASLGAEITHLRIIFFADIVDSTALTERLGDAAFREKARDLDAALRGIIRDHSGTPIEGKLLGDGVLATFGSARQAIEAALACGLAGEEGGLPLHLGLHAGDVIREEGNVFGGAVNVASRISGLSAPGEVLVSDIVRGLARTSAGPSVEGFEDRGEQALKGVGEPVRVWAVQSQEMSE
jgi:class 3 adenylate cyclase